MRHKSAGVDPGRGEPRPGRRALHPHRWMLERRAARADGSAFAFGLRLIATMTLAFGVVGFTGYVFLERNLAHRQISSYAATLRADAKAFEHEAGRGTSPADALLRVDPLLDAVAHRPGPREAVLISPDYLIEIGR